MVSVTKGTFLGTFKNTKGWLESIYKHCSTDRTRVLVGNKSDLLEETEDYVNDEAAKLLAEEHKMTYFKTSACKGDTVEEMVSYTIKQVYE